MISNVATAIALIMLAILTSRSPIKVADGLAGGCTSRIISARGYSSMPIKECRAHLSQYKKKKPYTRSVVTTEAYFATFAPTQHDIVGRSRRSSRLSASSCRLNIHNRSPSRKCYRFVSSGKRNRVHQSKQSDWDFFMPEEKIEEKQQLVRQKSSSGSDEKVKKTQRGNESPRKSFALSSSTDRILGDYNGRRKKRDRNISNFNRSRGNRKEGREDIKGWNRDDENDRINLRNIQDCGFEHLYGIAPVLNALVANRRDFKQADGSIKTNIKAEAQLTPYLFIQDQGKSTRDATKRRSVGEIQDWAVRRGIPVALVDKGVLNTLSGNRPHQGLVLRCGRLNTLKENIMTELQNPNDEASALPKLWLVLDEVVDPQNFGALLRSAYFLGSGDDAKPRVGVLVCSKNSSPASPAASASSAGAMELASNMLYSTNSLPRTLQRAREDGWNVLGAAATLPEDLKEYENEIKCVDLQEISAQHNIGPTLLVLGSEGHGMRKAVARQCTGFVRISGGFEQASNSPNSAEDDETPYAASAHGVDSLNVSVTGGIMLWHLLQKVPI